MNMQQRPMMILFGSEDPSLRHGMVAWGGRRMHVDELKERDLASRLGADRVWLDTLLEELRRRKPSALVLMDPDMSVFLGKAEDNWNRLRSWLRSNSISLTVLKSRLSRQAA
jgi:hypothetical protein